MMTKRLSHTSYRYIAQPKLQGGIFRGQIFPPGVIFMGLLMLLSVFCALWVSSHISDIGYRISEVLEPGKTVQDGNRQLRIARSANLRVVEEL